jgi:hypothetical protein
MLIQGRCHCGNLSFRFERTGDSPEIAARVCTCTFCAKHGGVWTSDPKGSLEVSVQEPERVSRYKFGTGTAEFHVCSNCGVVPIATSEIEGRLYAVVSVNAFEGVDASRVRKLPADFEGEHTEGRLARRTRSWIPDVRFPAYVP